MEDPGAAAEAEWAVRLTVARTLTGEEAEDRTMSQILVLARGRAAEVFDRACGLARIGRAGVDLDAHDEYRCLQAFYELGVKPPAHAEAAGIIIGMFGREGEQRQWQPGGCAVPEQGEGYGAGGPHSGGKPSTGSRRIPARTAASAAPGGWRCQRRPAGRAGIRAGIRRSSAREGPVEEHNHLQERTLLTGRSREIENLSAQG